jgi:hypothetical protein
VYIARRDVGVQVFQSLSGVVDLFRQAAKLPAQPRGSPSPVRPEES